MKSAATTARPSFWLSVSASATRGRYQSAPDANVHPRSRSKLPPVYVSLSRLRIDAALAPELVAAFRRRAHLVDDADGFVDLEVWQSDRDAGEIVMVSRWRDRDAFRAYMKSEAHAISHDRIPADLDRAIRLERLEHMRTYDVVAD